MTERIAPAARESPASPASTESPHAAASPRGPLLVAGGAGLLLVVGAALLIPWSAAALPFAGRPGPPVADTEVRARTEQFAAAVELPLLLRWGLPVLAALVMLIVARGPLGRARAARWWLPPVVVAAVVAAGLPGALGLAGARRAAGIDLATWAEWWGRWALEAVGILAVATAALWAVLALRKRWPRGWWLPSAGLAAGLVVCGSLVLPALDRIDGVRAEPALQAMVADLADGLGIAVGDVVVVEVGERTTAANAVVSGWGPTRQVAFTDTLVARAGPDELRWIAAHELAHVRNADVAVATAFGALGAIGVVAAVAAAARWSPTRRRLRIGRGADPRVATVLVVAVIATTSFATPFVSAMSRAVEARADVEALALTSDPAAMAGAVEVLARANLTTSEPAPWRYALFASHPLPTQRLARAVEAGTPPA